MKLYTDYTHDLQQYILSVTHILLSNNFFSFNDTFYVQTQGCPMGSCFSLSLANIYVAWWEREYLHTMSNPFRTSIYWYGRYIDDALLIWCGGEQSVICHLHMKWIKTKYHIWMLC
ncbi:hypothetical protein GDO81_027183 [Engystomops pustulosus]|uniref:Reverse transcriptase domain-containing protein n=1 Tax=Engystomops pustulosus TaxID=76066 RepID=A0AAV6YG51_ENGPU|nr:hypothetical protein GDO81_027183 [Engystomops pustulosus]